MAKKIELTDLVIRSLINNPQVEKEIPSLRAVFKAATKRKPEGCGNCRRARLQASNAAGFLAVRRQVLALSGDARNKIKKILGVDKLLIRIPVGSSPRKRTSEL